jgi:hypothetical protein
VKLKEIYERDAVLSGFAIIHFFHFFLTFNGHAILHVFHLPNQLTQASASTDIFKTV